MSERTHQYRRHVIAGPSVSLEQQFWSVVDKGDSAGCWLWTGHIDRDGYGKLGRRAAHRFAYELLVGPIPDGLEIDHVRAKGCISRACVQPDHLEPVTHLENVQRGDSAEVHRTRPRARPTHCKHGHEFTEANTYVDAKGRRLCRACSRRRSAAYAKRRRQDGGS